MAKYEFIKKAMDLGYSSDFINETIVEIEEARIKGNIFLDYDEIILCELPED